MSKDQHTTAESTFEQCMKCTVCTVYCPVVAVNPDYPAHNFGDSKGLTFDRVLIYPTKPMLAWFLDHKTELKFQSRSKLYVAITRARHSVGIVFDNKKGIVVDGIQTYSAKP